MNQAQPTTDQASAVATTTEAMPLKVFFVEGSGMALILMAVKLDAPAGTVENGALMSGGFGRAPRETTNLYLCTLMPDMIGTYDPYEWRSKSPGFVPPVMLIEAHKFIHKNFDRLASGTTLKLMKITKRRITGAGLERQPDEWMVLDKPPAG